MSMRFARSSRYYLAATACTLALGVACSSTEDSGDDGSKTVQDSGSDASTGGETSMVGAGGTDGTPSTGGTSASGGKDAMGGMGGGSIGTGGAVAPSPFTLNVAVEISDGAGTVKLDDADCGAACSEEVTGTAILSATPGDYSRVEWSGADCTGNICEVTVADGVQSINVTATFVLAHNIIFATSTLHSGGSIGSLANADAHCASLASKTDFHHKKWIAFLGTAAPCPGVGSGTCSPVDRFAGARGWLNSKKEPVFDTAEQLKAGEVWYPVRYDEAGTIRLSGEVVTGLGFDLEPRVGFTCQDYTTTAGKVAWGRTNNVGTGLYGRSTNGQCSYEKNRHYCISLDETAELSPVLGSGRTAFISKTPWTPGGGLSDADAHCQLGACEAGLTGSADCQNDVGSAKSFKAFLDTSAASAGSRFSEAGADYYRTDGLLWLNVSELSKATNGIRPRSGLVVNADGSRWSGNYAWTGATADRCSDWTSTSGNGTDGRPYNTNQWWSSNALWLCDRALSLYCLEE